jgi:hypothetical protein
MRKATHPDFFADASQLEMHKRVNRQQAQFAGELVRAIDKLGTLEDFQADERYRLLAKKAQESLAFLEAMSDFLDDFQDRVMDASRKVKKLLTETTETNEILIRKR